MLGIGVDGGVDHDRPVGFPFVGMRRFQVFDGNRFGHLAIDRLAGRATLDEDDEHPHVEQSEPREPGGFAIEIRQPDALARGLPV